MELKIIEDKSNNIMKRREIEIYVLQDDKTASKEEVKREVCKKLNLNPETTIVVKIEQQFGLKRSLASVHSYPDKATLDRFEQKYILNRLNKSKKEDKKEEKQAEKQEKKEEKKDEKKDEKKEVK